MSKKGCRISENVGKMGENVGKWDELGEETGGIDGKLGILICQKYSLLFIDSTASSPPFSLIFWEKRWNRTQLRDTRPMPRTYDYVWVMRADGRGSCTDFRIMSHRFLKTQTFKQTKYSTQKRDYIRTTIWVGESKFLFPKIFRWMWLMIRKTSRMRRCHAHIIEFVCMHCIET